MDIQTHALGAMSTSPHETAAHTLCPPSPAARLNSKLCVSNTQTKRIILPLLLKNRLSSETLLQETQFVRCCPRAVTEAADGDPLRLKYIYPLQSVTYSVPR